MFVNGKLGLKNLSRMARQPSNINPMADKNSPGPNRSEDAEKAVDGSKKVVVPDASDTEAQDNALNNYKITGVVGDYVDPTKDQEWDIAPEFGVAPHPELHNVAPPATAALGLGAPAPTTGERASAAVKALPQEEKNKRAEEEAKAAGDRPVSERLAAGRPDLRGNETVNTGNAEKDK